MAVKCQLTLGKMLVSLLTVNVCCASVIVARQKCIERGNAVVVGGLDAAQSGAF